MNCFFSSAINCICFTWMFGCYSSFILTALVENRSSVKFRADPHNIDVNGSINIVCTAHWPDNYWSNSHMIVKGANKWPTLRQIEINYFNRSISNFWLPQIKLKKLVFDHFGWFWRRPPSSFLVTFKKNWPHVKKKADMRTLRLS